MHASVILVLLALAAGGQQKPQPKPQTPPQTKPQTKPQTSPQTKPQTQTHVQNKVFIGDAYLVVIPVSVKRSTWYGGSKPDLAVTKDDVTIVIDNRTFAPRRVEPDKTRPGYYLVSFNPPPDMRDQKPRQAEIKIKKASIKTTLSF